MYFRASLFLSLSLLLAALPVGASSYRMATDSELLARADTVVVGRIMATENSLRAQRPMTEYSVEIERVMKGFVPASTIQLSVPGARGADDELSSWVVGAPTFSEGERTILFLSSAPNGSYRLADLILGAFREARLENTALALRDLSAANAVDDLTGDSDGAERSRSHLPRDWNRFISWIDASVQNRRVEPSYFVEQSPDGLEKLQQNFVVSHASQCGHDLRFPDFDNGGRLIFRVQAGGQPGIPGTNGLPSVQHAMNAWNGDPDSNVDIRNNGTTSNTTGATSSDLINTVIFDDPNDEISGSFSGSGTLATTTVWFTCNRTHNAHGSTWVDIVELDMVTQDGLDTNYFPGTRNPALAWEELLAHEFGHTIGISHSGDPSATMAANIHNDGRGASLKADDRDAVRFIYPAISSGNDIPEAPTNLTASAVSSTDILLNWQDNSDNETGFAIEQKVSGSFVGIGSVGVDATNATITGLTAGTFAEFRAKATGTNGDSTYSNSASATTLNAASVCVASSNTLCLQNNRFQVRATYKSNKASGNASGGEITPDTGFFTFQSPDNVELVVKVLNACKNFDRFWVFAAGLTDQEVRITVTDTNNGATKTYVNPLKTAFQPILDTDAFATCGGG